MTVYTERKQRNGMWMMNYKTFCETCYNEEGQPYTAWGLSWPGGLVHDFSTEPTFARDVAAALTRAGVEPCHIWDVLDNFLAGQLAALEK